MKTIKYNFEVRWQSLVEAWNCQAPIASPIHEGEFDYVNSYSVRSLNDVITNARAHLEYMERTYDVTFKIMVIQDRKSETFDIKNDNDMITMILKYS